MTHNNDKKGVSAAQATIISAIISAVFGPLILYGTVHLIELRNSEAKQRSSEAVKQSPSLPAKEVSLDMLGITPGAEGAGCTPLGKLQLCWGNAAFTPRNDPNTPVCDFALKFKTPFASPPSVTTSMQGKTSGFAYAVYSQVVVNDGITGAGLEVLRRASPEPVVVSYFAIGQPTP